MCRIACQCTAKERGDEKDANSDCSDKRGETVMTGIGMHALGYILNRGFTEINTRGVRYFGVVWTQTFANLPHPLNIAWMPLACRDPKERSLAMAMIIMSAKLEAIYGAQLFQEERLASIVDSLLLH